ncbi:MAG: hypothetical protein K5683_02740, partial [Prevotella sp.]|nr:hypothetical protein [Prevotella sp.]
NSFVLQMMAMGSRGTDKRLGEWLYNQDVYQILNISSLLRSIFGLRFGNLTPSPIFSNVRYARF